MVDENLILWGRRGGGALRHHGAPLGPGEMMREAGEVPLSLRANLEVSAIDRSHGSLEKVEFGQLVYASYCH